MGPADRIRARPRAAPWPRRRAGTHGGDPAPARAPGPPGRDAGRGAGRGRARWPRRRAPCGATSRTPSIVLAVVALAAMGILMVYSASAMAGYLRRDGDSSRIVGPQLHLGGRWASSRCSWPCASTTAGCAWSRCRCLLVAVGAARPRARARPRPA